MEELTGRIYAGRREYAASLAAELHHQLGPANPFLARGSRQNFIAVEDGRPAAHACAVADGRLPGGTGLIGYFEAVSAGAAGLVLEAACGALRASGAKTVYGPVNDTVWQRYGAAATGEGAPYQGEPFTPAAYTGYFKAAGFGEADRRITTALPAEEARFASYGESRDKLAAGGFNFTELGPQDLAASAAGIHAIASAAFADSPLFVTAGLDEFLYSAGGRTGGSILFMASDGQGKPAAFLWGLPDGLSGGENFIFKTIAVLPECRGIGLGRALFFLMHARAEELGARRFLFSTMRPGNSGIAALAARGSAPYREYLTFKKELC
jgi:GNAT superfamily N-acetyltransferase